MLRSFCHTARCFRTVSVSNLPSVQGALCVWRPSAPVSAALARVGPPSATWFSSGRRPAAPSPASAAASGLRTRRPAPHPVASRDAARHGHGSQSHQPKPGPLLSKHFRFSDSRWRWKQLIHIWRSRWICDIQMMIEVQRLQLVTRGFRILVPLVTPSSRWCSARTARPARPACASAPPSGISGCSCGRPWGRPPADGSEELCTACSAPCKCPGTVSWSASPAPAEGDREQFSVLFLPVIRSDGKRQLDKTRQNMAKQTFVQYVSWFDWFN